MLTQSWHTLPTETSHQRSLVKTEKKVLASKPHAQTVLQALHRNETAKSHNGLSIRHTAKMLSK